MSLDQETKQPAKKTVKKRKPAESSKQKSNSTAKRKPGTAAQRRPRTAAQRNSDSMVRQNLSMDAPQNPGSTADQAPVRTTKQRPVSSATKQKHRKINNILMVVLLAVTGITIIALIVNTVRVVKASSVDNAGSETSMSSDTGNSMKNDMYRIGNNPTDVEKEYFQKLTDAIKGGNSTEIAEAVVYNFVSDYFTWTNKDGNYEVGGLQYIYAEKYAKFEEWNRWYNYSNLDLYISQFGRENLPQVKEVTTEVATFQTKDDFTVLSVDPAQTYPCYQVQVAWTYEPTSVDTSDFPNRMRFQVVDHDGRFEIVEFYDMPSVEEWEAKNGTSDGNTDTEEDTEETAKTGESEG